jgi:hypothetical protein
LTQEREDAQIIANRACLSPDAAHIIGIDGVGYMASSLMIQFAGMQSRVAESFFAWYPGAQWKLLLPFGDWRLGAPVAGGVFAITVSGVSGERCEVHAAVLLKTSDNQIVHEALYFGADSLISCGWAR